LHEICSEVGFVAELVVEGTFGFGFRGDVVSVVAVPAPVARGIGAVFELLDSLFEERVGPEWVESRLDRFDTKETDARILEVEVNTPFYESGHVPGAICVDWEEDLRSADAHDIPGPEEMESFLGSCGITEETTVVVYGDNSNWFATHLYWQFTYYGHLDVRVMDGGREYWVEHDYPVATDPVDPPTVTYGKTLDQPASPEVRAYRDDVRDALDTDTIFVDVRASPRSSAVRS
jgi:thiosulfate/3-mercaptopyruvate sulfurtransferase